MIMDSRTAALLDDTQLMLQLCRPDPLPLVRTLHERGPVSRTKRGVHVVNGFRESQAILRSNALEVLSPARDGRAAGIANVAEFLRAWLPFTVGDQHRRLRRAIAGQFTLDKVSVASDAIRALCVDRLKECGDRPTFDLVSDYVRPITMRTVSKFVGTTEDLPTVMTEWADAAIQGLNPLMSAKALRRIEAMASEATDYFDGCIEAARAQSVIGALRALDLPRADIASASGFTFGAGDGTTSDAAVRALLCAIESGVSLASFDDAELYVDEILRLYPPIQVTLRQTVEPLDIGGFEVATGSVILIHLGAANRDPTVFERANEIALGRTPQRSLSFGWGNHSCVGASLARLEIALIVQTFLSLGRSVAVVDLLETGMLNGRRVQSAQLQWLT